MNDLPTIADLAKRLATVEALMGIQSNPVKHSWQNAVGTFTNAEFHAEVISEATAIREADREAGRAGAEDVE